MYLYHIVMKLIIIICITTVYVFVGMPFCMFNELLLKSPGRRDAWKINNDFYFYTTMILYIYIYFILYYNNMCMNNARVCTESDCRVIVATES